MKNGNLHNRETAVMQDILFMMIYVIIIKLLQNFIHAFDHGFLVCSLFSFDVLLVCCECVANVLLM
jgi:hypothetical protein